MASLPPELVGEILQHLPPRDLPHVRGVGKIWEKEASSLMDQEILGEKGRVVVDWQRFDFSKVVFDPVEPYGSGYGAYLIFPTRYGTAHGAQKYLVTATTCHCVRIKTNHEQEERGIALSSTPEFMAFLRKIQSIQLEALHLSPRSVEQKSIGAKIHVSSNRFGTLGVPLQEVPERFVVASPLFRVDATFRGGVHTIPICELWDGSIHPEALKK